MTDLLESLPALYPLHFFSLSTELHAKEKKENFCFGKKFVLPDTSEYLAEESFADIYMAWSQEAVFLKVDVHKPLEDVLYPDFRKGDSFEFFLDTRDLKTAGFPTRFCHHFLILPQEVQGIKVQEITKFRAEESRALCESDEIFTDTTPTKKGYSMTIALPAQVLHGFDPASFERLGFTYRLNRFQGPSQHFSISSKQYTIEQQPALWASLLLIK